MKKLIFGLLCLNISYLWADTQTTGSMKLLQPSTNTVDKSRSWGDKLNADLQIIDSTMSNTINAMNGQFASAFSSISALGTSTQNINGFVTAFMSTSDAQQNRFVNFRTTQDVSINALSQATMTLSISTTLIINQESPDISNRTYYVRDETTGTASLWRTIMSSPSSANEVSRTVNVPVASNIVRISSHITLSGDPGVRILPAGIWSFTTWAQVASIVNTGQLVITVSTVSFDGSIVTEIVSSTSTAFLDTAVDRFDMVAIQTADIVLSTSDRILVQYFGRSSSVIGINFTLYYQGTARFSHISSPIGSVYKLSQLSDAPSTMIGQRGKYLAVNNEETAAVWVSSYPTATAGSPRAYDLYVGTPGTPNVDVVVGMDAASFDAAFASIAARGMTYASSGPKSIYWGNGDYAPGGSTIPAGVDITPGSSVNWHATNIAGGIVVVYGRVGGNGVYLSFDSVAYAGRAVQLKSNSRFTVRGTTGVAATSQSSIRTSMFWMKNTTYCVLTGDVDEHAQCAQDNSCGGLVYMEKSSDCLVNLNTKFVYGGSGAQSFYVGEGDRNIIDGNYDGMGGRFIFMDGGNRGLLLKGRHHIVNAFGNGGGYFFLRGVNNGLATSTGVVVSATFEVDGANSSNPLIWLQGDNNLFGATIKDCIAYATANTTTFPTNFVRLVDSGVKYAVLANNHVFGMGLVQDGGTGTAYTSLANTNDITKP